MGEQEPSPAEQAWIEAALAVLTERFERATEEATAQVAELTEISELERWYRI
jgi:hypothetical protein